MVIDPLSNLPVIKDLVIDRHKVIRDLLKKYKSFNKSSRLWHQQSMPSKISNKEIRMGLCLECLCCQAVCQVVKQYPDEFVGPLGLLWFVQELISLGKIAESAEHLKGLFRKCDRCGACLKTCPDSKKPLAPAFSEFVRCKNNP
jgi:succinate dehydrogenase/fumarate reductase-like Fe-S protein